MPDTAHVLYSQQLCAGRKVWGSRLAALCLISTAAAEYLSCSIFSCSQLCFLQLEVWWILPGRAAVPSSLVALCIL